jgi:methylglutaconyl-CoA hydratase
MNYTTIEIERNERIATVYLNRPAVRNAFNEVMISEITDVFSRLGGLAEVRAVVLAARGPAFCAGADLNWMKKMANFSHEENLEDAARLAAMLKAIYDCPMPVIARVQGDCYAGGMGLVAACDVAVAASQTQFCLSEVKLGLIPATIAPYVIQGMGRSAARRYFVTAERFSAQQALDIGFVHSCVPTDELDQTISLLTSAVLSASPHAVKEAKRLVCEVGDAQLDDDLIRDTVGRIAAIRASDEGREGVLAFLEKRKPSWIF